MHFEALQYTVSLSYKNDNEMHDLTISHQVNVKEGVKQSIGLNEIIVNRDQVLINDRYPSTITDKCIDYSGKCIYPVGVNISSHDGRVQTLSNIPDIKLRWKIAKERLCLDYKGPVINKIAEQMDQSLSLDEYITNAVKNDLFFQLFFFPIYAKHDYIKGIEISHEFSIVPNAASVKFICTREIISKDADSINVEVKGNVNDKRNFNDIAIAKINIDAFEATTDSCLGSAYLNYELLNIGLPKCIKGYLEINDANESFRKVEIDIKHNEEANITEKNLEPAIKPIAYVKKESFWKKYK